LFKGKGLLHNDLEMDFDNPSFFSISMGAGIGTKNIDFGVDDMVGLERFSPEDIAATKAAESEDGKENIEFRAATVVDAEGAYFFNKYIGVGGRFRVRAMSAKSFERYASIETMSMGSLFAWDEFFYNSGKTDEELWNSHMWGQDLDNGPIYDMNAIVKSDHLTEFSASVGLYLNLPLGKRFSLGTKFLIGRSMTQEMDIDGYATGKIKNMDHEITMKNGKISNISIDYPVSTGDYEYTWDYMTLGGNNSTTWGTGLSLTYRYKSNFSWKVFIDYDYSEKDFTLKYDPLNYMRSALTKDSYTMAQTLESLSPYLTAEEYKKTKKMNYFTLGLSFLVNL